MTKQRTGFDLKGKGILDGLGLVSREPLEEVSGEAIGTDDNAAVWVHIERIKTSSAQPRKFFSKEKIDSLATTFKEKGFRGAINVRPLPSGDYEIVAGERRWRAAQQAGLTEVRCLIDEYSDEEALEFGLVENLLREDLSKLEETEGILELLEKKLNLPKEKVISIVRTEGHSDKRSRSDVAPSEELLKIEAILGYFGIELQTFRTKNLRTLSLPEDLRKAHLEKNISYSSALELSKIKDDEQRQELTKEAVESSLSFRDIKEKVQDILLSRKREEQSGELSLIERLELTVKRAKKSKQFLEEAKQRRGLERLLKEIEKLLDKEESSE